MNDKINILGVNVDMVTIDEAVEKICSFLDEDKLHSVYTPNSEIIMMAYKDAEFAKILNKSELLTADGIGVVYASRILKKPLKERAAGYDIAKKLLAELNKSGSRLFLFGGKPGIAEKAQENIKNEYNNINIVGTRNGYFKPEEEQEIIDEINNSGADVLFVCIGAPAQEKFIDRNRDKLKVKVAMGIGGSLDVFAGVTERAPKFWCDTGLEWLYRLIKEPKRFVRMLALPKFGLTVVFKGKRYKKEEK